MNMPMPPSRKRRSDAPADDDNDDCLPAANGLVGSISAHFSLTPPELAKPKRHQIATACSHCRDAKLKCSGKHPTCTRCETRNLICVYDVSEEGVTRREHLRRRYHEQRGELGRAMAVLEFLQTGSDGEAAELLARLRLGDSVEQVYSTLESKGYSFSRPPSPALPLHPDPRQQPLLQQVTDFSGIDPAPRARHRHPSQYQPMSDPRGGPDFCLDSSTGSSPDSPTIHRVDSIDMPAPLPFSADSSCWPSHLDPALAHQQTMYPEFISDTMNPQHATHHQYHDAS